MFKVNVQNLATTNHKHYTVSVLFNELSMYIKNSHNINPWMYQAQCHMPEISAIWETEVGGYKFTVSLGYLAESVRSPVRK